ncbi:flagellar hook-basal body complex protein [Bacillus carboniphilus]|uniref:Flagellar hook protein FlgE n=1 Tax=Bacillus carboniphilus TaxID=86663 RepID=A0ABY9K117_9BACI|nr:flagellar hook-basal body complex protein [Bacillus carboniphilus]WLR43535.1 flagellar hook-basal body complex protein [Bacillus carboniphilus]
MLRSLYSGISGMKNFQTKLDVIGNNIANVNTTAFKKSRVTFQDLVSQQISGAISATGSQGGVNSQQVGLGSKIGSIDQIHTTGSTQTTGRQLDLSISGDGFFPVGAIQDLTKVNMDQKGQLGSNLISGSINRAVDLSYTRAGNFYLDENGYLVTSGGLYAIGQAGEKSVPTDATIDKSNEALTGILSFNQPFSDMYSSIQEVSERAEAYYDALVSYDEAYDRWEEAGFPNTGAIKNALDSSYNALETIHENLKTSVTDFNSNYDEFNQGVDSLNSVINTFNETSPIKDIITEITNSIEQLDENSINIPVSSNGVDNSFWNDINNLKNTLSSYGLDITDISNEVILFENKAQALQNPSWSGNLSDSPGLIQIPETAQSFSIGQDGTVTFVNSEGELKVAGRLVIANFANEGGLELSGNNLYRETVNSGTIDVEGNGIDLDEFTIPGEGGVGLISAGSLEMSNVDLSEEFTEMIVAQRGFQSNTKIISTSDEILQELVNLKR